jgi:hypothetical protein
MPRLWLLALAPVAAAYEDQMTGTGDQRATWRTDRYSPCPREDAGAWLRLTAQLGYQLSPVEQAVADGVPYLGDSAHAAGNTLDAEEVLTISRTARRRARLKGRWRTAASLART